MILQDWLPHARKSNYSTLVQISIGSTLWKSWMKNCMKGLHFTFAGSIANWGLLFVVWKKINATQLGFRCQTFWNHFRNAQQTHEDLLRRCRRMKGLIFKEKMLTKRKNEKTFFWVADWWLKLEKLREECKTLRSFRTLKLLSRTFVICCKKQIFDQNFQLFGWIWVLFFSCHQVSVDESKLLKLKIHFELETTKTFSFSL